MTHLSKTFSFTSILALKDCDPWVNAYDVSIHMEVATEHNREYNIAYARMRFWLQDIMNDTVLIEHDDQRLKHFKNSGFSCVEFPVSPVDQVVCLMLMSKLQCILEGRISITHLSLSSPADEMVAYHCDQTDHLHWFEEPGWWRDSAPTHAMESKSSRTSSKVISIQRNTTWKDHDLDWCQDSAVSANISVLTRQQDADQ